MLSLELLAREVVANWDKGDLAAAVSTLATRLDEIAAERKAHEDTIAAARSNYTESSDNDIEIDDEPLLSIADDGVWVSAWVWVPIDEEEE